MTGRDAHPHDHDHHHHDDHHHEHHHYGHDHHHGPGSHTHVLADGTVIRHGDHDHGHGHGHHPHAPSHEPGQARLIAVEQDILAKNDRFAAVNRRLFQATGVLVLNLMSSPGSGKTTLLVRTLTDLAPAMPAAVIEGDQ
ncbi:MAG: hydrogenase expression/formation protein hypB,Ni2+-binding GTPase [Pseudomonadota bacterium]|jgi:hydrogenase nickel incorporation protein HypB